MNPMINTATLVGLALLALGASFNAHAAVRCTNAAGATAYADNAMACPVGYKALSDVAAMPPATPNDVAQAQAQARSDKTTGDALEKQRLKEDRAAAKAQYAASKRSASKTKSCKTAELAFKRAQDKYDDVPSASIKHPKASKQNGKQAKGQSNTAQHTVTREADSKEGRAKKKAQRGVEHAQAKRDLACG
jgi:hypothetical protein